MRERKANGEVNVTSEWVHGNQDSPDICVDLGICPPFLKVVVDAFIADSG